MALGSNNVARGIPTGLHSMTDDIIAMLVVLKQYLVNLQAIQEALLLQRLQRVDRAQYIHLYRGEVMDC